MKKQICGKCNIRPNGPNYRRCNICHAEHMREWRKTHPLNEEQNIKQIARAQAKNYEFLGMIKKVPCQICGNPKVQRHHVDYSKPHEVIYLCRGHHLDHHQGFCDISHLKPQPIHYKNRPYKVKSSYTPAASLAVTAPEAENISCHQVQ